MKSDWHDKDEYRTPPGVWRDIIAVTVTICIWVGMCLWYIWR